MIEFNDLRMAGHARAHVQLTLNLLGNEGIGHILYCWNLKFVFSLIDVITVFLIDATLTTLPAEYREREHRRQ